jgi:ABC-type Fe3+ transport system substrate-binding protein
MSQRRHFLAASAGALGAAALGVTPPSARAAVGEDWNKVVADAKGQDLNLILDPYDGQTEVLKAFGARFPGIRVQATVLHPSDAGPRIVTEQKSGLYNWDVWWSTASTMNNVVLPAGGLDRIGDYFVLKEVADPANWLVPAKYQYTQENAPYIFIHTHFLISYAHYNADNVPGGNLTWTNFLDPSLRGNIEIRPPNRNHGGTFMLAQIAKLRGISYVEKLLTDMKPVYVDNDGQITNAVMRGDTAVGIGTAADKLYECGKAGGCRSVRSIPAHCMHSRGISVPKNAPHKAATKVFVNWMLGKEGQETYVKYWAQDNAEGAFSLRRDVKPDPRHLASIPDFKNLGQYVAVSMESSKPDLKAIQDLYAKVRG